MAERERIAQMHILGKNKSKIAAETGHTRKSIAKIIQESDIPAYIEKVRGEFVGLGGIAVKTLKDEMENGNYELAYKFLKDSGILADVQGRTLAARVAGVKPEVTHAALDAEARELILNSLSEADRRVFAVLQMFRAKSEAFGMPDIDVGLQPTDSLPGREHLAHPAEQAPQEKRGA
jgi:hypothetical protein